VHDGPGQRSGHLAYHEQPEEYADVVSRFVRQHAGSRVARRT
jgi:hypothetical protein